MLLLFKYPEDAMWIALNFKPEINFLLSIFLLKLYFIISELDSYFILVVISNLVLRFFVISILTIIFLNNSLKKEILNIVLDNNLIKIV